MNKGRPVRRSHDSLFQSYGSSGDPCNYAVSAQREMLYWIPACAGMTDWYAAPGSVNGERHGAPPQPARHSRAGGNPAGQALRINIHR
ncbi:MAG: hypothetical protein LBI31_06120 [Zoogloeaceae bacterium]|nr:hypothetical protein [Zoogloeaceae bacterium]